MLTQSRQVSKSDSSPLGVIFLLVLPWVHAWAPGPLPNLVPWMVSWACLLIVLMFSHRLTPLVLAQSWTIAAVLSSVIGLVQFFGLAQVFAPIVHVPAYMGDALGNLRQRNQLASLLVMGMAALLWWYARGLALRHVLWILVLLALGLAATASRTGLLQICFLCLWCWLHRRSHGHARAWVWASATLGLYLLASAVLPWMLALTTGHGVVGAVSRMTELGGCGSRSVLWSNVLHLIGQKPWTGWGWDALRYAHYITAYPGPRFCDILGNAHNLPLHIAFTWGVPVALVAVMCVIGGLWLSKPWRALTADRQLAWAMVGVMGLHSLLEYPLWYGPFQIALVLCLWLMCGPIRVALNNKALTRGAGVLILAVLCLVAFDYARVRQIYLPADQRWHIWRSQPVQAARQSWFFQDTALFAELTVTAVNPSNARWVLQTSQVVVRASPEPRVIEKLLESARLLQEDELFALHHARFREVYPSAFLAWSHKQN
jgi:O-antigen ligase